MASLTIQSGKTPQGILDTDPIAVFNEFGFREHLTPQRSNGQRAMVERIKNDARETLASGAVRRACRYGRRETWRANHCYRWSE